MAVACQHDGGNNVERIADVTRGCEDKRELRRNIGLPLGFLALAAIISPLVIPDQRRMDRAVEAELAELV